MAEEHAPTTAPKPFVFVLMPFHGDFGDIYKFGIKGAAAEVGAYAERVDEQHLAGGMLDRIYNQISKADVIVADMTGQNPNVAYEVGYAHALDKVVVLLTQRDEDIPFDLRHHQHIVYGGKIDALRTALTSRLVWAIAESRKDSTPRRPERPVVSLLGTDVPEKSARLPRPTVAFQPLDRTAELAFTLRNAGDVALTGLSHLYLLVGSGKAMAVGHLDGQALRPSPIMGVEETDGAEGFNRMYRLPGFAGAIPAKAAEPVPVAFEFGGTHPAGPQLLRLRVCTDRGLHDFDLVLDVKW